MIQDVPGGNVLHFGRAFRKVNYDDIKMPISEVERLGI
jgi:hypothetical protein